jgi:hypothetical protein
MLEISIQSAPTPRSYSTIESAIAGAQGHPLQERAREAGSSLAGSKLVSAKWGSDSCLLRFSNDRELIIQARNFALDWNVHAEGSVEISPSRHPVRVVRESGSNEIYDPPRLIDRIVSGDFVKLYVNELGLLLYTHGNPILWFSALRELTTNRDILYAWLDD